MSDTPDSELGTLQNPIPVNFIFKKTEGGQAKFYTVLSSGIASDGSVAYTNKSNTFTEEQLMDESAASWAAITNGNKLVTKIEVESKTSAIESQVTNIINGTQSITLKDATTSQKGVVQLATAEEVTAGTDSTKAVTPATLKNKIDSVLSGSGDGSNSIAYTNQANTFTQKQILNGGASITSKSDWASVGANDLVSKTEVGYEISRVEQSITTTVNNAVSAATPDASETVKGLVELATTAETTAGTDTVRAVTPAGAKAALDARVQCVDELPEEASMTEGVIYLVKSTVSV